MPVRKPKIGDLRWRKASKSANDGACVEVAPVNGQIAVRDSRNPDRAWLHYPAPSWRSFLQAIKDE
jgi:Domain of unknown function (DUF397)